VVTPVGEIPNYCEHGRNAILIEDDDQAVKAIEAILADAPRFQAMTGDAQAHWAQKPLYRESIVSHCTTMVDGMRPQSGR
jgi:hypothetical protein